MFEMLIDKSTSSWYSSGVCKKEITRE